MIAGVGLAIAAMGGLAHRERVTFQIPKSRRKELCKSVHKGPAVQPKRRKKRSHNTKRSR